MLVNLDLGLLLKASLTPNQFVYCYLLHKKNPLIVYVPEEAELKYLEAQKYIIRGLTTGNIIVNSQIY